MNVVVVRGGLSCLPAGRCAVCRYISLPASTHSGLPSHTTSSDSRATRSRHATLLQEERRAALEHSKGASGASSSGGQAGGGGAADAALAELRALQEDVQLPVSAVVNKLYPATQLAPPPAPPPPAAAAGAVSTSTPAAGAAEAVSLESSELAGAKKGSEASVVEGTGAEVTVAGGQAIPSTGETSTATAVGAVAAANGHAGGPPSGSTTTTGEAATSAAVDGRNGGGSGSAAGPRPPRQCGADSKVRPPRRRTRGDGSSPGAGGSGDGAGAAGSASAGLEGWIERAARADSGGGGGVSGVGGETESEAGDDGEEGEFVPVAGEVDDETTLDAEVSLVGIAAASLRLCRC